MSAEYEQHVIGRYSLDAPFGKAFFVELGIYDPQLMLENTPPGNDKEKHHTRTIHKGVSIVYSHELASPSSQLLMLSVSGGTEESQQEIIKGFSEFLGNSTLKQDSLHVSEAGRFERNMYIWKVDLATTQ